MGDYVITIHGHGLHGNGREDDAEAICQRFVSELAARGHHIESASVTAGFRTHLGIPVDAPDAGPGKGSPAE